MNASCTAECWHWCNIEKCWQLCMHWSNRNTLGYRIKWPLCSFSAEVQALSRGSKSHSMELNVEFNQFLNKSTKGIRELLNTHLCAIMVKTFMWLLRNVIQFNIAACKHAFLRSAHGRDSWRIAHISLKQFGVCKPAAHEMKSPLAVTPFRVDINRLDNHPLIISFH